MSKELYIFEANKLDGIMSRNKKFYPQELSQDKINQLFLETRINLGKKHNFDGKSLVQAHQKSETNNLNYPNGTYINLDKITFNKEDKWYEDLPADILLFSKQTKNIVVAHQMADCPILIAEDRNLGVTALAHCGASYINRKLPKQTIEALKKEYNSLSENIYVYIGSCAKKESYIYDSYPSWATSKTVWKNFIEEKNDKYYIDLLGAIKKQLQDVTITHIETSNIDTIIHPDYASHYGRVHGDSKKMGQNLVGCFYRERK